MTTRAPWCDDELSTADRIYLYFDAHRDVQLSCPDLYAAGIVCLHTTIRRGLAALAREGLIERVRHGYYICHGDGSPHALPSTALRSDDFNLDHSLWKIAPWT